MCSLNASGQQCLLILVRLWVTLQHFAQEADVISLTLHAAHHKQLLVVLDLFL